MNESPKGVLLVVDDEPLKRVTLRIELSEAGYAVFDAPDASSALEHLDLRPVDVVVTDLRMPGINGLQFLQEVKARSPLTHVIVITAFGSVDTAVEALKRGAYDYLTKPFATELLLEKIDRLLAGRSAGNGSRGPEVEVLGPLVGQSHASRRLFEQIRSLADNERDVLIQGENGTGKKLVAKAIHQHSRRSQGPMVTFSCTTCEPQAIDGELFGPRFGAAAELPAQAVGRLELATGGSLLLHDVDALPIGLQAKILFAMEQKALHRPGTGELVPLDVRLLCTTKQDLRQLVDRGEFREDLYYRLNALTLRISPLRERRDDIPVLVEYFLRRRAGSVDGAGPRRTHPHAMDALMAYRWPGNVRELEHVLDRAVALARGDEIEPRDIMVPVREDASEEQADTAPEPVAGLTETIAGVERTLIDAALRRAAGNQAKAAQSLGIPRTTLRDKMAKHGMVSRPDQREPQH